ncbi:uncharacterized protein [Palaemon carinicauda]|uniref:uncharacterized protein n=1 Tax=Palaemon carinicauda TaxID=392227 RepID=UPI0035B66936
MPCQETLAVIHLGLDYNALAEAQHKDPECQSCRPFCTSFRWEDIALDDSIATLLCDVSSVRPQLWIPAPMCLQVFNFIHGFSHSLCLSTAQLLETKFICLGITQDDEDWVGTCADSGVGTFPQPQSHFAHIHINVVDPPPTTIPMQTATSSTCTSTLFSGWILRFGIPVHITSDRGTTYTSQLWTSLANILGITIHQTTALNPAGNRMVERFHCTLKAALLSQYNNSNWFTQLPWVLLGLKTSPEDTQDVSVP